MIKWHDILDMISHAYLISEADDDIFLISGYYHPLYSVLTSCTVLQEEFQSQRFVVDIQTPNLY